MTIEFALDRNLGHLGLGLALARTLVAYLAVVVLNGRKKTRTYTIKPSPWACRPVFCNLIDPSGGFCWVHVDEPQKEVLALHP